MQQQVEKLEAHVETLLDILLDAFAKWFVLEATLINKELITAVGSSRRLRGLDIVRRSLMQSCVQDIAHITLDPHKNVPSINKVVADLGTPSTVELLRLKFIGFWAGCDSNGRAEAQIKFEQNLESTRRHWSILQLSQELVAFKTLRDQQLAHVQLSLSEGEYERLDVHALGLKWRDIGLMLERIEPIVQSLNMLVRCAGMNMKDEKERFRQAAEIFWADYRPIISLRPIG
jgi:hypothetical protein